MEGCEEEQEEVVVVVRGDAHMHTEVNRWKNLQQLKCLNLICFILHAGHCECVHAEPCMSPGADGTFRRLISAG